MQTGVCKVTCMYAGGSAEPYVSNKLFGAVLCIRPDLPTSAETKSNFVSFVHLAVHVQALLLLVACKYLYIL